MEMTACGASSLFFAATGDFVPVFGVFPGRFAASWEILSRFWGCFRDVLLLWGYFVLVFGGFPGCFVAVGDFVLVFGVFPGRFVAVGVFCPGNWRVMWMFCAEDVYRLAKG